jgi:GT2 family glycosyltransferase
MRVRPGWADALVAALTPEASFVAGRTLASEGAAGELISVTRSSPQGRMEGRPGQFAPSNNLLMRRSSLLACGGFDERMGPGTWLEAGEDLELIDRVVTAGGHGRFAEDALAVHEQWRDARARRRVQYAYGKGMGARYAALLRHDRARALRTADEVFRLKGLRTLLRRSGRTAGPVPTEPGPADTSGVVGPLLWRGGALLGLVVGLWVLRPGPGAPSGSQVPVDD